MTISDMHESCARLTMDLLNAYEAHRANFLQCPSTSQYLGAGTAQVYTFVRNELGIPVHRGLEDQPMIEVSRTKCTHTENGAMDNSATTNDTPGAADNGHSPVKRTIGSQVSIIHDAIRNGRLYELNLAVSCEVRSRHQESSNL